MNVYLEGNKIIEGRIDFPPKGNARALLSFSGTQMLVWAYVGLDNDGHKSIRCYKKRLTQREPDAVKVAKSKGKSPSRKAGRAR